MNAIVFAPRMSPEIAARHLGAAMLRNGEQPPTTAALADALTRAACHAAEHLIDAAATIYSDAPDSSAAYVLRAAIAEARTTPASPRLPTLRERRHAARELAQAHNIRVQAWMLWRGWTHTIGCETCRELGPAARCWGAIGCHGYLSGCGCRQCGEGG